ncbi:MAG: SprB repeat-containing protein, partial [Bacteroidota bacterium]
MQRILPFFALCLCFLPHLSAQLTLSVRVDSATVSTTCDDILSGPDILFEVSIAGEPFVTYDPAGDACYQSAPNVQYQTTFAGACNAPTEVEVCLQVLENDALIIPCAVFPDCLESICGNLSIPAAGNEVQDTLELVGGASEGSLFVTITLEEDPNDFNYVCGAVDLGTLDYGQTIGDINAGLYDNNCADSFNEIDPVSQGNNLINNHGVWLKYTTGDEVSPLQVVRLQNDPENTGDEINLEALVYRADSCTGELQRFPLFILDYGGFDAEIRLLCPEPNTDYYILVDGAGGVDTRQGVFSAEVFDPGLPAGADLKCDADDLGIIPEGGSVASPTPVGNFCAGFSGDPFVQNFISRNSVWFTFRAPSSGHIMVEATSSAVDEIDIELALYRSFQDTCFGFLSHLYSGRDPSSFDESFTFSCLDPGRQYWILVDGAGSESVGFFDLTVTDLGDIRPVTMQTDTVCFGGSIAIGGGQIIHDSTGVYVDTIKIGATNCDSIIITDLTVLPELQLEIVQTAPAIGAAGMDGEATATATGGSGNYTITWCDGSTGPMNTNLVAGANCCVNVMDDQGCSYDTCFVVDFVEPFEPFDRFSEPLCQG